MARDFHSNFIFLFPRTPIKENVSKATEAYIHWRRYDCIPAERSLSSYKNCFVLCSFQGYFYVHSHQSISHIIFLILYKFMMFSWPFLFFQEIIFVLDWISINFERGFRMICETSLILRNLIKIFHHFFTNSGNYVNRWRVQIWYRVKI